MKLCNSCKQTKTDEMFHKRAASKDGLAAKCRDCAAEYQSDYRTLNKDTLSKSKKEYRLKNSELIAAKDKAYRESNKDEINKRRKLYRQTDRAKLLKRESSSRRRALLAGLPDEMPDNFMQILIDMYGVKCMNPECPYELDDWNILTHDHIIPVTLPGSTHSIDNSQLLCRKCNSSKGNRTIVDYRSYFTIFNANKIVKSLN